MLVVFCGNTDRVADVTMYAVVATGDVGLAAMDVTTAYVDGASLLIVAVELPTPGPLGNVLKNVR